MLQTDIPNALVALLPRIRRFALVLTQSADAADELVQSALDRALHRLDQFQPGTQLDRWMFSILKSTWLNSLRSAKVRSADQIEDHAETLSQDGVRAAEARVSLGQVREAFGRLPEEQRQALFLVSVEGYTYAEAAEMLGVPMGTVISRLARGRAALMGEKPSVTNDVVTLFRQRSART